MDWELIKTILGYISGPIIGAIIGLCTNYIAVKMLFRPYYPKRIGGITLPFTPGIIPKRKDALAAAIGRAVGEELFTAEDIRNMLCSDEVEGKLLLAVKETLSDYVSRSCEEIAVSLTDEVTAQALKDKLSSLIVEKILSAASKMELAEMIAKMGKDAIMEKKSSLGMLGMFLTDGVVDPLLGEVKERVNLFIDEQGAGALLPAVSEEVSLIVSKPINEQIDFSRLNEERITATVRTLYEEAVVKTISCATESLDICAIVEDKVKQMDVRELETLCLRVMKKELNAVVYLGGVIGLLLGIINIFI